jgi:hypothetical protein
MKTLNFLLGVLVLAASALAAPAVLSSIVAGAAGLLMVAFALQPAAVLAASVAVPASPPPAPVAVVRTVAQLEPLKVVELDRGVVVFRMVDGKLVSRFYRA